MIFIFLIYITQSVGAVDFIYGAWTDADGEFVIFSKDEIELPNVFYKVTYVPRICNIYNFQYKSFDIISNSPVKNITCDILNSTATLYLDDSEITLFKDVRPYHEKIIQDELMDIEGL